MGELEIGASIAYYLFIILGSITPGYLAVRFTYPDVRTFNQEEKLGASVLLGAFIAVLAILADVLVNGLDPVFNTRGYWPVFWIAAALVAFGVMFFGLRKSDKPEVAVPATKRLALLQKELESLDEKPHADSEVAAKLDALRKKGVIAPSANVASDIAPAPVPATSSVPAVSQNVREAKRILEQARETEVEAILSDLQLDSPLAVSSTSDSGRHRRLYLASRQNPPESEEKQIVDDVYLSFHDAADANKKKEESKSKRAPDLLKDEISPKPSAVSSKLEPVAKKESAPSGPLSMADLFGEPKAKTAAVSPKSVFAQLDKEVTSVPVSTPPVCPTCHQKNSRIVFCPYCGTGMCANCSPKVIPGPDGFTYTCPKCQEDIPVKKKQNPA